MQIRHYALCTISYWIAKKKQWSSDTIIFMTSIGMPWIVDMPGTILDISKLVYHLFQFVPLDCHSIYLVYCIYLCNRESRLKSFKPSPICRKLFVNKKFAQKSFKILISYWWLLPAWFMIQSQAESMKKIVGTL